MQLVYVLTGVIIGLCIYAFIHRIYANITDNLATIDKALGVLDRRLKELEKTSVITIQAVNSLAPVVLSLDKRVSYWTTEQKDENAQSQSQ